MNSMGALCSIQTIMRSKPGPESACPIVIALRHHTYQASHMLHRPGGQSDRNAYLNIGGSPRFGKVRPELGAVRPGDQGSVTMKAVPHEASLILKELDLQRRSF